MPIVKVSHLKRYFKVYKRSPGVFSSIYSIFKRSYKDVKAVDDITFNIDRGELVGFIGPNGAGKTTTLKCLSGLLYPTDGNVSVLSYNPFDRKTDFLKKISLVMGQKNQLWWDLPSFETFRLNKEIYDMPERIYKKTLNELSDLLEVQDLLSTPVRQLSLGQRMKMELIAALIHKPKILFLDEPTIGLDVLMQKKIRNFIRDYNKKYDSTILLTSHYMSDVKELCRRIIIIDYGKIIFDGNIESLIEKYADFKLVSMVFSDDKIKKKDILRYGKVQLFSSTKASLIIPKKKSKDIVTSLLQKFPIEDLNIQEPELEEVIRIVFRESKK